VHLSPLYVQRDPESIARSLWRRDCFGPGHAQKVVKAHLAGIAGWWRLVPGGATVSFKDMLQDPVTALAPAAGVLNVLRDVSTKQLEDVESFLDPELNHHG
jgi:hypothetical protein